MFSRLPFPADISNPHAYLLQRELRLRVLDGDPLDNTSRAKQRRAFLPTPLWRRLLHDHDRPRRFEAATELHGDGRQRTTKKAHYMMDSRTRHRISSPRNSRIRKYVPQDNYYWNRLLSRNRHSRDECLPAPCLRARQSNRVFAAKYLAFSREAAEKAWNLAGACREAQHNRNERYRWPEVGDRTPSLSAAFRLPTPVPPPKKER